MEFPIYLLYIYDNSIFRFSTYIENSFSLPFFIVLWLMFGHLLLLLLLFMPIQD
jgi:hypothetical protein